MLKSNLDFLRLKIDEVDEEIISLLFKRMEIVAEIDKYKKAKNIPIDDKKREDEKIQIVKNLANLKNLNEDITADIFKEIINMSKEYQRNKKMI